MRPGREEASTERHRSAPGLAATAAPRRAFALAGGALCGALAFSLLLVAGPAGGESAEAGRPAKPAPVAAAVTDTGPFAAREAAAAEPVELPAGGSPGSVASSDDLEQSPRRLAEGSEAAHYRRFLELGRRHEGLLAAEAERAFDVAAPAPLGERSAVLRALWASGSDEAARWFGTALAGPTPELADFALRFLAERAPRDPAARGILADHVAGPPEGCDAARLARAAAALEGSATVAARQLTP